MKLSRNSSTPWFWVVTKLPKLGFGISQSANSTGTDPETLRLARAAKVLVVSARRSQALAAAAVVPDVIVGSVDDPRENRELSAYDPPPGALVLTDGPRAVRVFRGSVVTFVPPPPAPPIIVGDYGAGDSFAAALTIAGKLEKDGPVKANAPTSLPVASSVRPICSRFTFATVSCNGTSG